MVISRHPLPARARRVLEAIADGRDQVDGVTRDTDSMDRICLVLLCRGLISSGGSITLAGLAAIGRVPIDAAASRMVH